MKTMKCEKQMWDGIEVRNIHLDVLPIVVWKFSILYIHSFNQICKCVKEIFDYFFSYGPCVFYYYLFHLFNHVFACMKLIELKVETLFMSMIHILFIYIFGKVL
jgi:hypothetical protein